MPQIGFESTRRRQGFLPVLILILAMAVPLGFSQQPDWQAIDVDGLFSFRLPPDWSRRSSSNVAEVRGEWVKGGTKLVYVWGQTGSGDFGKRRQPWMTDYEETTTRISGRRARIRSFSGFNGKRTYQAELVVGNWEKGEVQLYMRIEGSEHATIELAKQVFKSVTLPLPPPERTAPR